jgi:hypothetical protein
VSRLGCDGGFTTAALRGDDLRRDVGAGGTHQWVNLGQCFPEEDGPAAILKSAVNVIAEGVDQYPPGPGSITYDPGTEAIAASVIGLVEPGFEVLLIEPFYRSHSPVIAMAGCQRVVVALVADERWARDRRRRAARRDHSPRPR